MKSSILSIILYSVLTTVVSCVDHPTLPTLWKATTIDPPMGQGVEEYKFVSSPTTDNPSAMWSKYNGCSRLIYADGPTQVRYLLGCDAVECCTEEQEGNQVEFQIPNVHFTNPSKKIDVSYQKANITNFGEEIEADEWSWSWNVEKWKAYTLPCGKCYGGVQLLQWEASALGTTAVIQFKDYRGIDPDSEEGKEFIETFTPPSICDDAYVCPDELSKKYFNF